MLIYVNKKKQRQQRIKRIVYSILFILIITVNLTHLNNALNTTDKTLSEYNIKEDTNHSLETVKLFLAKEKTLPKAIIIPSNPSEQTFIILADTLSKINNLNQNFYISEAFKENKDKIKTYLKCFNLKTNTNKENSIILTSNFDEIKDIIYKEKLYPKVLSFTINSDIKEKNEALSVWFEKYYPKKKEPKTSLEKQYITLKKIAKQQQNELIDFVLNKKQFTTLTSEYFFLQNASICLKNETKKECVINQDSSLKKNLTTALKKLNKTPEQIVLLTPLKKVQSLQNIHKNTGIVFKYENRLSVLLPSEINGLSIEETIKQLKRQIGLNPDYTNENMEFYKFKAVEVNLDDNI